MPMHCVAYSQSQDEGGVLSYVTPVPDPSVRVNGNDIVVPQTVNKIIGAMGCIGTTGVQAQLVSPSLRRVNPYNIFPFYKALVPSGLYADLMHEGSPIQLDYNEALDARILADPAAAEQQSIAVFMADAAPAPANGAIVKVRFSVVATLVAGQWVNAPINFVDLLPTGTYSVVGSYLLAPSAVVARWFPVGGQWRPGFPVAQTAADIMDPKFRNGRLGKWFDFDEVQPPTIDIMSSAAAGSTTYYGTLDLIPAGGK